MGSNDEQPKLLPGVSAIAWDPVFKVLVWVAAVSAVPPIAFFVFDSGPEYFFAELIPLFVSQLLTFTALAFRAARAKKEIAAGYTTLWRENPTLPQLDAKSGELIRIAGDPYLVRNRGSVRIADDSLSSGSVARGAPSWRASALTLLPSLVISLAGFSFLFGAMGAAQGHAVAWVIATVIVVLVLYAGSITLGGSIVQGRLARLRLAAPFEFGFVFAKSKGYEAALNPVRTRSWDAKDYIARGATANGKELTIWEGNPPERTAVIAWSRVTSVQVDTVPGSNFNDTMVLITYQTDDDDLVGLPLAYPKENFFPAPSKAGVRWIVAQLNDLRSSASSARLI